MSRDRTTPDAVARSLIRAEIESWRSDAAQEATLMTELAQDARVAHIDGLVDDFTLEQLDREACFSPRSAAT